MGFSLRIILFMVFAVIGLSCSSRVTRVTRNDVHERVKRDLPIGSTLPQAKAFLESLEINGIKARRYDYVPRPPVGTDQPSGAQKMVRGYMRASIDRAASDYRNLQEYRILITLYFGEDERLSDYKIEAMGDW